MTAWNVVIGSRPTPEVGSERGQLLPHYRIHVYDAATQQEAEGKALSMAQDHESAKGWFLYVKSAAPAEAD